MINKILIQLGCILLLSNGYAATMIVGTGQTYTTIAAARTAAVGGDTIIVKDGTYSEVFADADHYWPNGSSGAYTIIKAENDGGAIITGQLYISRTNDPAHTSQYLQIEGFKFKSTTAKEVRGNHIKFFRCAFEGGPATDNAATIDVGTDNYNDTNYILFEDCWSYGQGGRYNISIFNADHVVLRRFVARHDSGWDDRAKAEDPEAGINVYNSSYVELQDVIVIDSDRPLTPEGSNVAGQYSEWQAGMYIIHNPGSPGASGIVHDTDNNYIRGSIVLNVTEVCYMEDGGENTTAVYSDVICAKTSGQGYSGGSSGGDTDATFSRFTFHTSLKTGTTTSEGGFSEWDSGTTIASNGIITGFARDFHSSANVTRSYIDLYNNDATSGSCTNCVTVNPATNGLLYLPRIEDGSYLTTHGSSGGQIGATMVKKMGTSGAGWGESGYNTITTDNLWPWPYEARIKSDFASVATLGGMVGARGFATGNSMDATPQTLTKYIWEALGNQIPAEIYAGSGSGSAGRTISGGASYRSGGGSFR